MAIAALHVFAAYVFAAYVFAVLMSSRSWRPGGGWSFLTVPQKARQRRGCGAGGAGPHWRSAAGLPLAKVAGRQRRIAGRAGLVQDAPGIHPHRVPCMSTFGSDQSPPPAISNKQLALIVYILYFVAYFTGITALIGVIIAHVQVASADPLLATHYRFQIRTFWIGILYLVIGTILSIVIVGIAILLWWFVWSLVRNVKGTLALNDNKPIANPASWMFG
jgi:uncharacterized membrane protein